MGEVLYELFAALDVAADVVTCGEDALEAFASGAYDLVLTDYRMPGMTGFELAEALRARDASVPVAIVTGSVGPREIAAIEAARFAVLAKPFGFDDFKDTVARILPGPEARLTAAPPAAGAAPAYR